jgi:hypothetical protein
LAQAQADVRAYGAEVRNLATALRSAGDDAKGGLQAALQQTAGELARAEAQARSFRAELAGPVKTAAGEAGASFAAIGGQVKELAALFGVGFGAEKLIEGIKSLAEFGEKTENIAAAVGAAPERYAKFAGALSLVGGDADTAAQRVAMMERQIRNGLENPGSPLSDVLKNLGFSPEQLQRAQQDTLGFIEGPLADRYKALVVEGSEPGLALADFSQLAGGRAGLTALAPLLKEGSAGVAEYERKWQELSGVHEKEIKDLADTDKKIHELETSFKGLGVAIYENFKQPIDDTIVSLKEANKETTGIVTAIKAIGEGLKAFSDFAGFFNRGGLATNQAIREGVGAALGVGVQTEPEGRAAIPPAGGGVKEQMQAWLGAHGYSAEASAAILGNASVESSFNPAAGAGGAHFGLFQWDKERAKPLGGSTDVATQMALMDSELQKLDPAFKTAAGDVAELTKRFEQHFERSGGQLEAQRETAAVAIAGGEAPGHLNTPEEKRQLQEALKAIDDKEKRLKAYYAVELEGARDNEDAKRVIRAQEDEQMKKLVADADAAKAKFSAATGEPVEKSSDLVLLQLHKEAVHDQIAEENRLRAAEMTRLEGERRLQDQAAAASLGKIESQRRIGNLTGDQAAGAEELVVAAHAQAVARILADEQALWDRETKGWQEVENRKAELVQKSADQIARIDEKAQQERFQRAHAIDSEIAGSLSNAIVNAAWGGGRNSLVKAFDSFVQSQEKKVLDQALTKLFDFSGVGNLLGGAGDKLFGLLPGAAGNAAPLTAAGAALTSSAGALTGAAGALTASAGGSAAAAGASAAGAAGSAASGAGGGFSLFGWLGGLFGFEHGGVVPSARHGWTVPSFAAGGILSELHRDEMVLPAGISKGLQSAIAGGNFGGGGGTVNLHVQALDGHSVERVLLANHGAVARAMARATSHFNANAPGG